MGLLVDSVHHFDLYYPSHAKNRFVYPWLAVWFDAALQLCSFSHYFGYLGSTLTQNEF